MSVAGLTAGLLALVLLAGLLLPFAAWSARRQSAALEGRAGAAAAELLGVRIAPWSLLARALSTFSRRGATAAALAAATLGLLPAVLAFALVPYAARYRLGDATWTGVAIDADAGIAWLLVGLAVARSGPLVAGVGARTEKALLASLREGARQLSSDVLLALSLLPPVLIFASLRPSAVVAAQDRSLPVLAALATWIGVPAPASLEHVVLPAWGIVLQPLAFLLFLVAVTAGQPRSSAGGAPSGPELAAGHRAGWGRAPRGLELVAERCASIALAGAGVTLFLGGYAIPWLPQERILAVVGASFGHGVAAFACGVAHLASFACKTLVLLAGMQLLAHGAPRPRVDQALAACWRWWIPLALANVLGTAVVLLAGGTG